MGSYPEFTGEEAYGRFVDLHVLHNKFINSKFGTKCEYIEFVKDKAWSIDYITWENRITKEYRSYLSELLTYLEGFFNRSIPLGSLNKIYKHITSDFNSMWRDGKIPHWKTPYTLLKQSSSQSPSCENTHLDLTCFPHPNELKALGTDALKKALQHIGLSCGRNIEKRIKRLWKTRTIPLKKYNQRFIFKESRFEKRIIIEETTANITRKQTKSPAELEVELIEVTDLAFGRIEDNDCIYNPLKLPMGPDGKPIPYWLYKLHGLNRKIECEICGNYVYEGRRAFEKHFKEARHSQGMQALGIPNTKAFFEITNIKDAIDLWDSIKSKKIQDNDKKNEQEFEDADGNLYDKVTYELLKKHALL